MRIITTQKSANVQDMLYNVFTNNGVTGIPNKDKYVAKFEFKDLFSMSRGDMPDEVQDLMVSSDLSGFIHDSAMRIVNEAIEPELNVLPNLFYGVRYEGPGRSIELGSLGAFHASEVPEGGEYEEVSFNFGEGQMIRLSISKHGLKLSVTDEVIEDSLFDVFGLWLRMAGRAMARHREEYAIKLIQEGGITLYDNQYPDESELGITTGRNIEGSENGSATANDMYQMVAWQMMRGFNPDVFLMNPLAWKTFMTDTETREVVLNGATLASYRMPGGSGASTFGKSFNGLGYNYDPTGKGFPGAGGSEGSLPGNNPFVTTLNPLGSTFNIAPRYLPNPVRVIVSPHIPFAEVTVGSNTKYASDLYVIDSSRCGLFLQKEDASVQDWKDPERDIQSMKIKERWGMALLEAGKGIAIARDIVMDRNYNFENVNQKALSEIDTTSAVVS